MNKIKSNPAQLEPNHAQVEIPFLVIAIPFPWT